VYEQKDDMGAGDVGGGGIVVVLSRGNTDVNLLFTKVSGLKSLIFLAFTAWAWRLACC